MEKLLKLANRYFLITTAKKVYGPYNLSNGRKIVIIKTDDGKSRTVSYPKHLLEEHLGKELDPNECTIDHIDFNKDNNDLSNLRIVPRDQHSADDTRRVKLIKLTCPICNKKFERSPRLIRDKSKSGKTSAFCSKSCVGRYSREVQLGLRDKLPVSGFPKSEYFRRKNIKSFIDYLEKKYG